MDTLEGLEVQQATEEEELYSRKPGSPKQAKGEETVSECSHGGGYDHSRRPRSSTG